VYGLDLTLLLQIIVEQGEVWQVAHRFRHGITGEVALIKSGLDFVVIQPDRAGRREDERVQEVHIGKIAGRNVLLNEQKLGGSRGIFEVEPVTRSATRYRARCDLLKGSIPLRIPNVIVLEGTRSEHSQERGKRLHFQPRG